eukprot:COSAG04_NODE_1799_length_5552_cov_2.738309_8_plen_85_part_00
MEVLGEGVEMIEIAPGVTVEEVQAATGCELHVADDLIEVPHRLQPSASGSLSTYAAQYFSCPVTFPTHACVRDICPEQIKLEMV